MHFTESDIAALLTAFPGLRRRPTGQCKAAVLSGRLRFEASAPDKPTIADEYRIRVEFSLDPTIALPKVFEDDKRIPVVAENHVNPSGDLCLGSPLKVMQVLGPKPTLIDFVEKCVVPFLYAASWRERGLPGLPFDELAHGAQGLVHDYERLFSVVGASKVATTLQLLGKRKRVANKRPCPCSCGRRLARCAMHARLAPFRELAPRPFYVEQAKNVLDWIRNTAPPRPSVPTVDLQPLDMRERSRANTKGSPPLISRLK